MDFKLFEILENNNKYLCLGKIDNELAIILSDFFINDFDNVLKNSSIKSKVGNCYTIKNKNMLRAFSRVQLKPINGYK